MTIPTIGHSPLLIPLVNEIEKDRAVDRILLTVNLEEYVGPVREFFRFGEPHIEIIETWSQGKSLYHGWNTALDLAEKEDAYLAVLNDDIRLFEPNAISHAAQLLETHPKYAIIGLNWQDAPSSPPAGRIRKVNGSYRHYGVGGFAWVCDPHKMSRVPDDIVHWCGDDFLFYRARDAGHYLGIANNIHVEHPAPETTSVTQPWTFEVRGNDREAFEAYYPGEGW